MSIRYLCHLLFVGMTLPFCILAQDTTGDRQQQAEHNLHPRAFITEGQPIVWRSIKDRMIEQKVNGVSIAVIDGDKVVWTKGYGLKDVGMPGEAVDTTTRFQCASIGKVITSLAALHLVHEGRIGLDEPVNNKLHSWRIPENDKTTEKKVTLRTLLSHTAGFDDGYGFEGYFPHTQLPDLQQMLNSEPPANTHKKLAVKTVPGTVEQYSGAGFLIVQQLVEDITGVSFGNYVDSIIFKPLHMLYTAYALYPDETLQWPIARGHDEKGRTDKKRKYQVYPELAAAGPWTTAGDLALLVLEIQKGYKGLSQIIADSGLLRQMLSPQINNTGLGIHLKGTGNVAAFWHAGNNAGYTGMLFGTTSGQGAIVLTNSDSGEWLALEVIRSIADAYHWPAMQTQYVRETTGAAYDSFVGEYGKGTTAMVTIGKNNAGLFLASGTNQKALTLLQARDGSFLIKEKPDHFQLVFEKELTGTVSHMQFSQNCGRTVGRLQKIR